MKKSFFLILIAFMTLNSSAFAEAKKLTPNTQDPEKLKKYHAFIMKDIRSLRPNITSYEYELMVVNNIFSSSRNNEERKMSLHDVELRDQDLQHNARVHQLREILRYDWNFDMRVTKEELAGGIYNRSGGNVGKNVDPAVVFFNGFMKLDTNNDGILTYDEMSAPTELRSNGYGGVTRGGTFFPVSVFKRIDVNNDGFVVPEEVMAEAKKAFSTVDLNKDGALSEEEVLSLYQDTGQNRHPPIHPPINPPPVKSGTMHIQ